MFLSTRVFVFANIGPYVLGLVSKYKHNEVVYGFCKTQWASSMYIQYTIHSVHAYNMYIVNPRILAQGYNFVADA